LAPLLDDLNEQQREAVTHGEGPLLVLAGAGSGKTRVLTYRLVHLLATGQADPTGVTAVTFTNKAAREMRERVDGLLGHPLQGGFVGTFHRWALEILRRYPEAAGLPRRFAIADGDDQRSLVSRVLKDLGLDPRELAARLTTAADGEIMWRETPADALQLAVAQTQVGDRIVVCGSFEVVGPALQWLEVDPGA